MIDLTERILQTPASVPCAAKQPIKWHPWRRILQLLCGVLLVALPLTNGLRLDVRRGEFYFAWHRMAAHDIYLLFWVAMLGVWTLVAVSVLYGRLWCGWVCPQTLASDFADSLKTRLDELFRVRSHSPIVGGRGALIVSRTAWTILLLAMSVGTGAIVACYWLAPHTVALALRAPWTDGAAGATIYGIAAVVLADMLWVRRKFCATACPYGALLGVLADKDTLAARYLDERDDDCIRCGKCVTACPTGIDIKQGVGQFACIGCGECVDACNDVLGKRGKPGLIEFRYGLAPERHARSLSIPQRWGLWDGKRYTIVATLALCVGAVGWYLYGHTPLTASVTANGAIMRDARAVSNTYTLTLANGTPDAQDYSLAVMGLPPGATVAPASLTLPARGERTLPVSISAPAASLISSSRMPIRLNVRAGRDRADILTNFYTPAPEERQ